MRLVFFGTPDFAAVSLRKLVDAGQEVLCVVTQPDRPRGRGRVSQFSPAKVVAEECGLAVLQPNTPGQPLFLKELRELSPDLLSVVAYGHILRQELLDIPSLGSVGVHPSLLPKYRGAAPINWALIRGERSTGITTFFMNEAMDAGEIILQSEVEIPDGETAGELEQRLSQVGANLLVETIELIEKGEAPRVPQNDLKATYAPKIGKEDCLIEWNSPAAEVRNLIHGLSPTPGAYTFFRGGRLKILRTSLSSDRSLSSTAGEILEATDRLSVACRHAALLLEEIQPEGRRAMSGLDFINGHRPKPGERLG